MLKPLDESKVVRKPGFRVSTHRLLYFKRENSLYHGENWPAVPSPTIKLNMPNNGIRFSSSLLM